MAADMTVRVSCKYKDGEWQATSPVYKIMVMGCGETPEMAIEDYVAQLRRYYEGRVFEVAYGMPFDLSYQITGMSAEVSLNVRREASLSSFGISVCQDADDNRQDVLEGDVPYQLPAAEGDTSDYLDSVVATIEGMQQRDPVVDSLFRSGYTDEDKEAFERKMVEQDLRRIRCEDCVKSYHRFASQQDNSNGLLSCSILNRSAVDITDAECPGQVTWEADPNEVRKRQGNTWALPVSNDVINGMYIVANSSTPINYVILPNSGGMSKERGISVGDRVILYETAVKKGRKAYIGECVVDELHHVPRDKVCSTDWSLRLSFLYQDIAGAIGSGCSDVRIARVIDLKLYPDPLPVPQGSSIPHGLMGLTGWELAKIFNDKSVLDQEV